MPPRKARAPNTRSKRVGYKQQTLLSHFSSSPPPSSITKGKGRPKRAQESESEVEVIESPVRKPARRQRPAIPAPDGESDSSDVGKIKFERQSSTVESVFSGPSSSDHEALSPNRPSKRPRILNSDSDEIEVSGKNRKKLATRRLFRSGQHEGRGSQSEADAPKKRNRLIKGTRPSSDEEDDDVMDGIDEDKIVDRRLRGQPSRQNKYLQNLEKLKKKKMGVTLSESEEEDTEDEQDVIPGARPGLGENEEETLGSDVEQASEDDVDGFIVNDEGEAQTAALPAIFSMNTHQDLIHHFKIVCQYLVHLAVTTPTARLRIANRLTSDEYFSVPLSITRRKLADIRDSLPSSVWRPAFKKALMTFPEFDLHVLDFAIPQCDACHLGGRLSKFVGRLGGVPYDRITFHPKDADSESSSDESDSGRDHSAPEFNLGRFCAQRTEIFHELCHWEFQLFVTLSREVEELSNSGRGFVKIAFAGGIRSPEDISDADQVMEWLDQRGIINAEWLEIKQLMSRATNLEADAKSGRADD